MSEPLFVRITKLGEADAAQVRAGDWGSYVPGAHLNTKSLPVDYELAGTLIDPPIPRCRMKVLRLERNDVRVPGIFIPTPIRRVIAVTDNSVYWIEPTEPPISGVEEPG